MNVHAKNQQRPRQLLQFFDDIFVALAGRNHLVDPTGKWMRPGRRDLQPRTLRRGNQLASRSMHLNAQFANVFADFRSCLHDGLVHFMLHLILNRRRNFVHQLHHVRTQFARRWIDDLEFFFNTDGEAVSHGWPSVSLASLSPGLPKKADRAPRPETSPVSYPIQPFLQSRRSSCSWATMRLFSSTLKHEPGTTGN